VYYRPSKSTPCRRYAPTIVAFTDSDKEDSHSELMVAQREGSAIDLLELALPKPTALSQPPTGPTCIPIFRTI
jgi:hypothetical protein